MKEQIKILTPLDSISTPATLPSTLIDALEAQGINPDLATASVSNVATPDASGHSAQVATGHSR